MESSSVASPVTTPTTWSTSGRRPGRSAGPVVGFGPPKENRRCNSVASRVATSQDATLAGCAPTASARNA